MSTTAETTTDTRTPPPRRRRSRIWRVLKWTLLVVLSLILVVFGLIAWVATTERGLAFAWGQIDPRLPEGIEVARIEGRLIGPLEIRGVEVDTDSLHLAVDGVDLDWTAAELLSATVHVRNLAVRGVDYEVTRVTEPEPEPEQPGEPFSLPDAIELPVTVQFDRVSMDDLAAITAPEAEPFEVDTLRLVNARLDGERWRVESLTGHGPMFDLDADAELTPRGSYATNLGVDATLRLPDLAPVKARADIKGDLSELGLAAQVAAPYNLKLKVAVADALGKPRVDATAQLDDTHLQKIRKDLPEVGVNTTIEAEGPIDDLAVTLDSRADSADFGKAVLSGLVHYTPSAVVIDRFELSSPDTPGTLSAGGQVALAEGNAMDLHVNWSKLQWPLAGEPAYRSDSGSMNLTGEMTDYALDSTLAWQVVGQTEGKLSFDGTGTMKSFKLAQLAISGGPGEITGKADVVWAPALDVTAELHGRGINPGAIVADVPGDFDLDADVRARQTDDVLTATVDKLTANGSLRNQPLRLNAKAQYVGDHVVVDTFELVSGATTASVSGRFGWAPDARLDGRWSIDSSDLSSVWPTLGGTLETEGTAKGQVAAPNVQATLSARNIVFAENSVDSAKLDAGVDWSGNTRSNVDLDITGVEAGGQAIDTVTLELDGTLSAHSLAANVDSDIARLDLGLDGGLNKETGNWRFTLNQLRAAYDKLAPWTLASPAAGSVSAEAQSIDDACLTSGEARLCLTGRHDAKASSAKIRLSDFAYDYAEPFFPEGLEVAGTMSGTVDARLPAQGDPDIDADLRTSDGYVNMAQPDGETVRIVDMEPGRIRLEMQQSALDAKVALPLAETGSINADVSVAAGSTPLTERRLDGSVEIDIARLDVVEKLSPEVDELDGRINGDLRLGGSLAQPNVLGDLKLLAPRIVLVSPGLVLKDVRLAVDGQGDAIGIDAAARSGGGDIAAEGAIALNDTGQDIDLKITGERFQVANTPDATAYVSPDLEVAVTPSRVDVTGRVTIPEAAITPRDLPDSGVQTVSGDQVIVTDDSDEPTAVARAVNADVEVVLGDKVRIEGFGLKANLTGNLEVVQAPGDEPTGTGEIRIVDGSYRAYGQNLDIQEGRILFAGGPVSEPGLDIRAARYPTEDVTVGVVVRGSIRNPRLTLFSDPGMGQSEKLSWLLLGRPLEGTTGQQSSLVARAALALGSTRGNKVLDDVGDKLGVDDIGIGAGAGESSDQAAFTVGKYLSPKLYVSYGIGLFDPVSTLSLRYTLSSRWRLETQSSGATTGGDIIYSIDR